MSTKIYCDIADLYQIKKFNKKKIVEGFTTNPSLMRKAGAKNYEAYSKKILKICKKKPISFEVFSDDYFGMEKQALKITKWGKNVYVKIPVINSKGIFMGKIIKYLKWKSKINFDKGLQQTIKWYLNNKDFLKNISKKNYQNRLGLNK